jgi:hypothetical protein
MQPSIDRRFAELTLDASVSIPTTSSGGQAILPVGTRENAATERVPRQTEPLP